jgi:hypothetical protein
MRGAPGLRMHTRGCSDRLASSEGICEVVVVEFIVRRLYSAFSGRTPAAQPHEIFRTIKTLGWMAFLKLS